VNAIYSLSLLDNSAELRIGSSSTEPEIDRTPPAWIDDVRIYSRALNEAELNEVRQENLQYVNLFVAPGFIALGGVPGSACNAYAQSISADGSTVVGQAFGSGVQLGYRWKNGVRSLLVDLPGGDVNSNAVRTSADGSIAVGWGQSAAAAFEAVQWDAAGNCTSLGDFPGGELSSSAYGVSNDGSVIVGVGADRPGMLPDAFRYFGGVLAKLGYLPGGTQSAAYDVSQDGTVIVGVSGSTQGSQAFRWEAGQFTPLGDLAGGFFESRANKVAAGHGVVVGWGLSAFGREAACWGGGRLFGLGDLAGGAFNSEACGVSSFGSYIVGKGHVGQDEAFIWDRANGMRSLKNVLETDYGLDLTGWYLSGAAGISDNGSTITAYGVNPTGLTDSILVRLPVPSAIMDFDADEDVDLYDFTLFTNCATGPGVPYNPAGLPPGCTLSADTLGLIAPDFDWDGDVDQIDFSVFQRCMGASGDSPPARCRG
jgi:probable HAF family extracellular repeat protein